MDIKYLGHSSFLLSSRVAKVVTDPFDPDMVGLKFPRVEAQIVTVSHHHHDHDAVAQVGGNPISFDMPGEYEVAGVRLTGFPSFHDAQEGAQRGINTIFKIELDGVHVVHLGDLGHIPSDEILEEIDTVDVLLVPVGGVYTIGPDEAAKVVAKIEPAYVVPMHFGDPSLNQATFAGLAPVSEFLQKIDAAHTTPVPRLSLTKADITDEEMKVIVFERT